MAKKVGCQRRQGLMVAHKWSDPTSHCLISLYGMPSPQQKQGPPPLPGTALPSLAAGHRRPAQRESIAIVGEVVLQSIVPPHASATDITGLAGLRCVLAVEDFDCSRHCCSIGVIAGRAVDHAAHTLLSIDCIAAEAVGVLALIDTSLEEDGIARAAALSPRLY